MTKGILVLFDLDDTLYSRNTGVLGRMTDITIRYCMEFFGVGLDEATDIALGYWKIYGHTIRGLMRHHSVCGKGFIQHMNDNLPLEDLLTKDSALIEMISSIPYNKWIFTNSDENHARRVLRVLGVEDHFEGIISPDYSRTYQDFLCKPSSEAFCRVYDILGQDQDTVIFVDDNRENIETAAKMGWRCIHIRETLRDCVTLKDHVTADCGTQYPFTVVKSVYQVSFTIDRILNGIRHENVSI